MLTTLAVPVKPTYQAPPPPRKSAEQTLDADPHGKYIYRPGELVWFNRGTAWGLSVIAKRQILNDKPRYLVQPLSHPYQHLPAQIKDKEDDIRPWLAWSVPNPTIAALRNLTFDTVPWDRVLRGELGNGDVQVDGSILAAKTIDGSYSLFDRLDTIAAPNEVHYNGMFLGAEKIWAGEPVRLRYPGEDLAVLIIQKMIERTSASPPGSVVTFIGDIYKFVEMPSPYKTSAEWPTPLLPARMVADLHYRNRVSEMAGKHIWHEWRLLEPAARRGLADIKGRWYETEKLLPILRGTQQFEQDVRQGIASDSGIWMNSRGDSSTGAGQRKKHRLDTFGQSVPAEFKVSRGLDGIPADDLFPDAITTHTAPRFVEGDMDEFMNLDPPYGA